MRILIKEKDSKKIFKLLKEGYEISMQTTIEGFNNKTNYVIFAYKRDKNGNYIEEQEKTGE